MSNITGKEAKKIMRLDVASIIATLVGFSTILAYINGFVFSRQEAEVLSRQIYDNKNNIEKIHDKLDLMRKDIGQSIQALGTKEDARVEKLVNRIIDRMNQLEKTQSDKVNSLYKDLDERLDFLYDKVFNHQTRGHHGNGQYEEGFRSLKRNGKRRR